MSKIPAPPTPLIGRGEDVSNALAILAGEDTRLLTLVGPAGIGKTRLAVEVASRLKDRFADGVFFVDLSSLEDPGLLSRAIAAELGLDESSAQPLLDQLKGYLGDRDVLLVLDNFEQIVVAATVVAELLGSCPRLKVVVTSRVPLQLRWERQFPVSPLEVPDTPVAASALEKIPAVALFVERARSVRPDFMLTDQNATAVAEICLRLDGVPLAIELSAAQTDVQSPQMIIDGLERSGLDLLGGGPRDVPERHRTLRDAIAWSERLLDEDERKVFHRLAVFSNGCTVEAAEAVCSQDGGARLDVRAALASLVRKNLLRFEPVAVEQSGRYRLLEMIREYGLERLRDAEEEVSLRANHLDWCLALAAAAEPELRGAHQKRWMDILESEHPNFRSALSWCERTSRIEDGLRIVAALGWFWLVRSHLVEGSSWFTAFLDASKGTATPERMRALSKGAWLAHQMGERQRRATLAEEALQLARLHSDQAYESWSLQMLARGYVIADPEKAVELAEQSLHVARAAKDESAVRLTCHFLSVACFSQGRLEEAKRYGLEAERLHRQAGDPHFLLWTLGSLGSQALRTGDHETAKARFSEQLALAHDLSSMTSLESAFRMLALLAAAEGDHQRAACLIGVSEALQERVGSRLLSGPNVSVDRSLNESLATAREAFGPAAFDGFKVKGRAMTLDDALAYARSEVAPVQERAGFDVLTAREAEVAGLVAQGLTNRQIAEKLVIAVQTADRHVSNILGKLGLNTRSQLAVWYVEQSDALPT